MTGTTSFGDISLDERGIVVERVHDDITSLRSEVTDRAGAHGAVFRSVLLPARQITLDCFVAREDWADYDALRDELMAHLSTGDEQRLEVRTHPGEYYVAHFTGFTEGERIGGSGIGEFTLTFVASDPFRYGETREVSLGSGGSALMFVGGTTGANLLIECPAARRDTSTRMWGVTFDDEYHLRVSPDVSGAVAVSIDTATRRVLVAGETSMVTLDSDWPDVTAGRHEVRMDLGTGAATVSWTERWI